MHYKIPTAPVVRFIPATRRDPARFVIACPWCRCLDRWRRPTTTPAEHTHGAGGLGEDPRRYLGDRASHCLVKRGNGGYYLTDPDNLVPTVNAPAAVPA